MKREIEYDENCIDLETVHGRLVKMECIRPWSDEVYKDTSSPFNLSGWYKLTFEDGAEVEVGSLYAYALAQGSFWLILDHSGKVTNCVFVREPRALAYFAQMGASLKRDREGECNLPSTIAEAEKILWGEDGFDVPYEPLKYGGKAANENMEKWIEDWKKRGLVRMDEEQRRLELFK